MSSTLGWLIGTVAAEGENIWVNTFLFHSPLPKCRIGHRFECIYCCVKKDARKVTRIGQDSDDLNTSSIFVRQYPIYYMKIYPPRGTPYEQQ